MAIETKGTIVSNRKIRSVYFRVEIHCPAIVQQVKPGQFVMLRVAASPSPLLKRPFSVYRSYSVRDPDLRRRGNLVIIYKKVGRGTERMTELKRGEKVEMIGPLGNGFRLPSLPSSSRTQTPATLQSQSLASLPPHPPPEPPRPPAASLQPVRSLPQNSAIPVSRFDRCPWATTPPR